MKPIIINMNEMSDSREVYESKPNRALPAFLYTCIALVAVAILWMCLGKIDIAVNASGMLRPGEAVGTVVNVVAGEVLSLHAEDGSTVEAGEVLYVIGHEELLTQKEFYESQSALYTERITELETYLWSVREETNHFSDRECEYALRYESFRIQLEAMRAELAANGAEKTETYGGEAEFASVSKYKYDEEIVTLQSLDAYNESLRQAEIQLAVVTKSVEDCYVKAPCAGVVNMLQEPVVGNRMASGAEVCSILPAEESDYKCVIYVENADVGGLEPGMSVKLNVYSYPNSKYGYVYGTLTKVSEDIRVDGASGMAYYLAEATVDAGSFLEGAKDSVSLKAGMACEAKIITGEQQIMSFVLEKLNLLVSK